MHPHRRSCRQHPRASLHWTGPPAPFRRERHLIRPGLPVRLGGPEVSPCCCFPVPSHQMTRHGSNHDYIPTLLSRHSLPLPLRIIFSQTRQSLTVCRFGPVSGPCPTGVAYHADRLPDVGQQAHPVEDGHQGVESTLEPGGVRRYDHTVVCVKNLRLVPSLPPRFPLFLSLVD